MQLFLSGNIRRYRKALGLTQEQLAEAMNVTVGRFPSGKPEFPIVKDTTPNITTLRLYIAYFKTGTYLFQKIRSCSYNLYCLPS